nr:SDR family oxidoreductase [Anaeropeptidivorans aminofermentans]
MMSLFDLTGKVAVVTGASSGLGVQFAHALAEQGASLALVARRKDRLDKLAEEFNNKGTKAIAVKCDASKEEEIIAAVKEIKNHFGRIDILVNNAGVGLVDKAENQSKELWDTVIGINLTGVFLFSREVAKVMIPQKYGKIINLGSLHSNTAISAAVNSVSAYCASKGGVQMLTKSLAAEWAQHNITVNAIGPAYFPSEMTDSAVSNEGFKQFVEARCPMGRFGRDGELNGALIYFASDASSYTTGQLLNIDGGWNTI